MSEPRSEEREDEVGDRAVRDPARDHLQRTKPDPSPCSQGPLSSIRAAIKRSRTNSPIDPGRERRRPEITILSAEPLANSSWFPGASGIFTSSPPPPPPVPESSWPAGSLQVDPQPPPSYDQVIREKRQEEHVARPTAAPRRSACTSTSATQTDPVREEASAGPASGTGSKPDVKKPQKPPRPLLLKTQRKEPTIGKSEPTDRPARNVKVSLSTENQNNSNSCIGQRNTKDSTYPCSRSVTVQWEGSAKNSVERVTVPTIPQSAPVNSSTPSSESVPAECPVPLPRLKKSHGKHLTEEITVQTLVSLSENADDIQVTSSNNQEESSSNKYFEELLEVFGEDNSSLEDNKAAESESDGEMSAIHSQRELRARIAAFETQTSTEEEMAAQPPKPQPRNMFKPPVSSKPSIASRPSFKYSGENNNLELPSTAMPPKPLVAPRTQKPSPAPRPQASMKREGYPSIGGLQETMPSKAPVLPPSRLSIKAKVKSLEQQQEENHTRTPPVPAVKPFKEPVIPNNQNSMIMATEDDYDTPSNFIGDLQGTLASKVPVLPPSRSSIKDKVKSLEQQQENHVLPPVPGAKPFKPIKEPLIPNLNLNNHDSSFTATEDQYDRPSNFIGNLQETLASKVPVLPPSRPSIKDKVKSLEQHQENHGLAPPVPPVKPLKEPLVPNVNNYNSTFMAAEDQYYDRSSNSIGDFQETMPSRVAVLPTSRHTPPVPPTKLFKESPIPNLNHDSAFTATEDQYDRPSDFIGNLQETLASKVPVLPPSRPSIKDKVKSLEQHQENHGLAPPVPPVKPLKEPLVPNINNYNSTFMAAEDQYYDRSSNFIGDLQEMMPSRVAVLPTSRHTPPVPPTKPFKEPPIPNLNHDSAFTATEDQYDRPSDFIGNLQETLASKVPVLPPSHPSIKAKVKSLEQHQENHGLAPPVPPVKPLKEPLIPNVNNYNSTFMATEDQYYDRSSNSTDDFQETMPSRVAVLPTSRHTPPVPPTKLFKEPPIPNLNHDSAFMATEDQYDRPSDRAPFKLQASLDSAFSSNQYKHSNTRRPTTIRVNSVTDRSPSLDTPPALPIQMPVGSMQRPETSYKGQGLTLPPRPSGGKVLPPRPPPAKVGPARPPAPGHDGSGGASASHASQRGAASAAAAQRQKRRGPALPPRPRPGHRLYNKYTLELPHGIAVCNYNGPKAGELSFQKNDVLVLLEEVDHRTVMCQAGDDKGRVQSCHMKVITPLASQNDPPQIPNLATSVEGGGLQVQAIHDFSPAGPGELGLRAGDVVSMVEQVDNEWYYGTCRGSTGFFPINYVNVLSNPLLPSQKKKKPSATVSGPRCVARFDFEGEQGDELSFSEGDVISLMEYVGDEWAKGQLGHHTGIFPLNFVEVVEELPLPPMQQQTQQQTQARVALPGLSALPNIQPEAVKPIQAPQPAGPEWVVALYDFNGQTREDLSFKKGDRFLVSKHLDTEWWIGRLNGREGIFPRAFVQGSPGQSRHNTQQRSKAGGSTAKALFQFRADCEEELSLQAGDIITNLESVDDEWFLGDLRGRRALVPKNYVQVLG